VKSVGFVGHSVEYARTSTCQSHPDALPPNPTNLYSKVNIRRRYRLVVIRKIRSIVRLKLAFCGEIEGSRDDFRR
jgi:hypothetical protein